jgi:hypothetical protein
MRNIEDDIYGLWSFLWNSDMIGSVTLTDETGQPRVRYFLNDYGKTILKLLVQRYRLQNAEELVRPEKAAASAKVLIVCRFCGAKTEQGLTMCQKCGAEL